MFKLCNQCIEPKIGVNFVYNHWCRESSEWVIASREEGDIGLFITLVPKLSWCFLIRWLNDFGNFYLILIGWFINLSVQTFQQLILIYIRDNFVYHYLGCTSIYRPMSYSFRSLQLSNIAIKTTNLPGSVFDLNNGLRF